MRDSRADAGELVEDLAELTFALALEPAFAEASAEDLVGLTFGRQLEGCRPPASRLAPTPSPASR